VCVKQTRTANIAMVQEHFTMARTSPESPIFNGSSESLNSNGSPDSDDSWQPSPRSPITTLMFHNVPQKYDAREILAELSESLYCGKLIDFLYLPCDLKTHANMGYVFVNFTSEDIATKVQMLMEGRRWEGNVSKRKVRVTNARVQGFKKNVMTCSYKIPADTPPELCPIILECGKELDFQATVKSLRRKEAPRRAEAPSLKPSTRRTSGRMRSGCFQPEALAGAFDPSDIEEEAPLSKDDSFRSKLAGFPLPHLACQSKDDGSGRSLLQCPCRRQCDANFLHHQPAYVATASTCPFDTTARTDGTLFNLAELAECGYFKLPAAPFQELLISV